MSQMFSALLLALGAALDSTSPGGSAAPPSAPQATPAPRTVVLTGATVHSLAAGKEPALADVVITNGRIAAVLAPGAKDGVPADAQRVALTGLHLVPGLVDGMVNHDAEHDRIYVANGVTLVRDLGSELTQAIAERDVLARERGPGPAIWAAGTTIGAEPPAGIVAPTPELALQKLTRVFGDYRLDYLSVMPDLSAATWNQVLTFAHEKGVQVWGPLRRGAGLAEVLDGGQDGLFHVDALLPAGKSWSQTSYEELAPRVERLGASKTALVPTLAYHATRLVEPQHDAPELKLLSPIYVQQWIADGEARRFQFTQQDGLEVQKAGLAAVQLMFRVVKLAHERGVKLVPGSASPNPWLLPGRALVEELVLWGRAGLPPADVLRAATVDAAKTLGDASRGTIEAGKVADLVAYARDPEQDLTVLREPAFVVLRGRVLGRADLDRLLDGLEAQQRVQQARVLGTEPLKLADLPAPIGELRLAGEVEQRIHGLRYSVEKYAVARLPDGAVRYQTRLLTLGAVSTADTELYLEQTVRDNRLAEFKLDVNTGATTVHVTGTTVGNVLNVERRTNDAFIGTVPVKEKLAFVDVGSVVSAFALAQHGREGTFRALFFEDFEPAHAQWQLHVEDSGKLLAKTQSGALTATFDAQGRPGEIASQVGRGLVAFRFLRNESFAGGLALPEANVRRANAADASAPK